MRLDSGAVGDEDDEIGRMLRGDTDVGMEVEAEVMQLPDMRDEDSDDVSYSFGLHRNGRGRNGGVGGTGVGGEMGEDEDDGMPETVTPGASDMTDVEAEGSENDDHENEKEGEDDGKKGGDDEEEGDEEQEGEEEQEEEEKPRRSGRISSTNAKPGSTISKPVDKLPAPRKSTTASTASPSKPSKPKATATASPSKRKSGSSHLRDPEEEEEEEDPDLLPPSSRSRSRPVLLGYRQWSARAPRVETRLRVFVRD